jgi:acetyl-CoA C-acetyltransferase
MPSLDGRVAVIGVGCTPFAEHWAKDQYDLLADAVFEAAADGGIAIDAVDAAWVGIYFSFTGLGGSALADAIHVDGKPITRVENYCASGMDAFRNAVMAVAGGFYDIALACGVEKLTDQGSSGLPPVGRPDPVLQRPSSPGYFALQATRAFHEWGWSRTDLARVAVKNHANGAHHPLAHFRRPVTIDDVLEAPEISSPLGRLDCAAVSDGAAAVIVARPELARDLQRDYPIVTVKAVELAATSAVPTFDPAFRFTGFPITSKAARRAYAAAGITDPREAIDLVECHDCFTITELLNMQDLGLCDPGEAAKLVADGVTSAAGDLPVNPSGGLKCFGHPIGATGVRMIAEITRQLQGRALGVQVAAPRTGLAHNLGGPGAVAGVTILQSET